VLELTADGLTNAEVGQSLFITEETVKTHVRKMLAKLQARNRSHAVGIGFRDKLIS
jgi:DNA-binding CsgD family transcriptional regulator